MKEKMNVTGVPETMKIRRQFLPETGPIYQIAMIGDDSETAHPITEEEMIKIEKIHGPHFVFPESMLKMMLPIGSGIFMKLAFQAARKYPKECQRARLDIDQWVRNAVAEWKSAEK